MRACVVVLLLAAVGCEARLEKPRKGLEGSPAPAAVKPKTVGPHVAPAPHAPAPPARAETLPSAAPAGAELVVGKFVTLSDPVKGYSPVIEDLLAQLGGGPESGRVVVTLAPGISPTSSAYCFFPDAGHHDTFLLASMRGERLTIRGRVVNIGKGFVTLEDCELR